MAIFSLKKEIDIDFKEFSLVDISNILEKEDFFSDSPSFQIQNKINDNHLVFITPRNKVSPREIYNFEYFPNEKKLKIKGKYENMFFPCLLMYVLPFIGLYDHITNDNHTYEQFKILIYVFIGVSIFCGIVILFGLSGNNEIERELQIRLNFLLRNR